jgi:hypothetical protein
MRMPIPTAERSALGKRANASECSRRSTSVDALAELNDL